MCALSKARGLLYWAHASKGVIEQICSNLYYIRAGGPRSRGAAYGSPVLEMHIMSDQVKRARLRHHCNMHAKSGARARGHFTESAFASGQSINLHWITIRIWSFHYYYRYCTSPGVLHTLNMIDHISRRPARLRGYI